jgi:hypothetical protein
MSETNRSKNSFRWLWLTGVLFVAFVAGVEIRSFFLVEQDWQTLFSTSGRITFIAYVVFLLMGLFGLVLNSFRPNWLEKISSFVDGYKILRWLVIAGVYLSIVWFYLYSVWQTFWPGPWTQFFFAAGLVIWIVWLASPRSGLRFGLPEFLLSFALFLYPRIVLEVRILSTSSLVYRSTTIAGCLILLFLTALPFFSSKIKDALLSFRSRFGNWRFVLAAIFIALPFAFRYSEILSSSHVAPSIRLGVLLLVLCALAFLITDQSQRLFTEKDFLIASLALAVSIGINYYLLEVVAYPFSLTWSEGNRFYDYSLVFGQGLYQYNGAIVNPYASPGRYGLWGILFLLQGLPIWAHRLWDALVRSLLPIVLGWALSRRIEQKTIRLIFFLWVSIFFMVLSPVHPPFVLALIIALAFGFESSLTVRAVALFIASFYAGLSRWTWVVAPASWGVLVDLLLFYPERKGNFWQRLKPAILLLFIALVPGVIINFSTFFSAATGAESLTMNQPLLWYRLLPNPTYQLGVGPSVLLATGPLLVILAWLLISKRWQTDWLQKLAISGALTGFLVVGLIISAKIGGGGDLHNLDMYLAALILIVAIALILLTRRNEFQPEAWPFWIQAMLAILMFSAAASFTPFTDYMNTTSTDGLPDSTLVAQGLNAIQTHVAQAMPQGEILFMDQRQLITFGYLKNIPFVPDYEKKYMMDQAMGSDANYFMKYYRDLARARFSLIITEPLKVRLKGEASAPFSEENDDWVKWVSEPTLCFYKPIYTDKANNFQLLVPRPNTDQCAKYLTGE